MDYNILCICVCFYDLVQNKKSQTFRTIAMGGNRKDGYK